MVSDRPDDDAAVIAGNVPLDPSGIALHPLLVNAPSHRRLHGQPRVPGRPGDHGWRRARADGHFTPEDILLPPDTAATVVRGVRDLPLPFGVRRVPVDFAADDRRHLPAKDTSIRASAIFLLP